MIVLHQFQSGPDRCEYLPDREATLEHALAGRLAPAEYEALMNAGWRKFGQVVFRPVCQACRECRPIRIDAARFTPDRSQRRTLARNADLTLRFNNPAVDAVRLRLFNRYHAAQARLKGWPHVGVGPASYARQFVDNVVPSVEISVWEGETLRAVALADVTPRVVSGVYHYHDPDCRDRGLGTFVMLQTIMLAQSLGKPWSYFGFHVAGCPSMEYKSRFRPCQILGTDGVWHEAGVKAGAVSAGTEATSRFR